MSAAAQERAGIELARGASVALDTCGPATLAGGTADLLVRRPDGTERFVASLAAGCGLLPGAAAAHFVIRARSRAWLVAGVDPDGAGMWLDALRRAASALAASPLAADPREENDLLLAALVGAVADAEPARPSPAQVQDTAFRDTLSGFRRLIEGRFHRAPSRAPAPLAAAAARLAELMGVRPLPVAQQEGEAGAAYLDRFTVAHGLRLRTLRLDGQGAPEGEGPMLAFDMDDAPVVLKPRPLGGYDLEAAPLGGTPRRMRPADWERLRPAAFAFCRTLPQGPLAYREVIGFGLKAATADFVLLAACGTAGALLAMLPPIASQQITNIAVHTADTAFLAELLTVLFVALLVETSFVAIGRLAELRIQGRAGLALHAAMVDRLLRLTPTDLRSSTTLILATEMETVEKFRRALIGYGCTALVALLHGLAAAALVAFISPPAGLIAIALVLLLVGLTALVGWLQFKAIYEGERMDVIVLAFVYDLIRLVPIARGGRLERRAFTQWSENFLAFQTRLMRSARITNTIAVIEPFWDALMLAACFGALAYAGATASLSAGAAVAFVMALSRLTRSGKDLSHALLGAAKLLPMAKLARPFIEFKVEPLVAGAPVSHLAGRIDAADVTFFYGTKRALDGVSFTIEDGAFVSIAGPSGSGKSTLLAVIAGLEQPQAGHVLLGGHDLSGIDRRQLSRRLGIVLQGGRLFPGSLYDNIRGVGDIDLDAAWHFAEQAGIADELKAMPMGLRTLVSEAGSGLSLGQVQRILIARALAQSPAVLILDEAMSALDAAAQERVMTTLEGLRLTRIVVAHSPVVWARTDRVLVLRDGALVADGPPDEAIPAPPPPPQAPARP
jgi:ABC-type bacteriocin/lantibiotic exporter with double-glycine peptidase domain